MIARNLSDSRSCSTFGDGRKGCCAGYVNMAIVRKVLPPTGVLLLLLLLIIVLWQSVTAASACNSYGYYCYNATHYVDCKSPTEERGGRRLESGSLRACPRSGFCADNIPARCQSADTSCGSSDHACLNSTHFQLCVETSAGTMLRMGDVQSCGPYMQCQQNAPLICVEAGLPPLAETLFKNKEDKTCNEFGYSCLNSSYYIACGDGVLSRPAERCPSGKVCSSSSHPSICVEMVSKPCGALGHVCVNATHFETCVLDSNGNLYLGGQIDICLEGTVCDEFSLTICDYPLLRNYTYSINDTESVKNNTKSEINQNWSIERSTVHEKLDLVSNNNKVLNGSLQDSNITINTIEGIHNYEGATRNSNSSANPMITTIIPLPDSITGNIETETRQKPSMETKMQNSSMEAMGEESYKAQLFSISEMFSVLENNSYNGSSGEEITFGKNISRTDESIKKLETRKDDCLAADTSEKKNTHTSKLYNDEHNDTNVKYSNSILENLKKTEIPIFPSRDKTSEVIQNDHDLDNNDFETKKVLFNISSIDYVEVENREETFSEKIFSKLVSKNNYIQYNKNVSIELEDDAIPIATDDTQTAQSQFYCYKKGKFADPKGNESLFYCCVYWREQFIVFTYTCPSGSVFNPALLKCVATSKEVQMTSRGKSISRLTDSCARAGKFPSSTGNCSLFYVCMPFRNTFIKRSLICPFGSEFNRKEMRCSISEKAKCSVYSTQLVINATETSIETIATEFRYETTVDSIMITDVTHVVSDTTQDVPHATSDVSYMNSHYVTKIKIETTNTTADVTDVDIDDIYKDISQNYVTKKMDTKVHNFRTVSTELYNQKVTDNTTEKYLKKSTPVYVAVPSTTDFITETVTNTVSPEHMYDNHFASGVVTDVNREISAEEDTEIVSIASTDVTSIPTELFAHASTEAPSVVTNAVDSDSPRTVLPTILAEKKTDAFTEIATDTSAEIITATNAEVDTDHLNKTASNVPTEYSVNDTTGIVTEDPNNNIISRNIIDIVEVSIKTSAEENLNISTYSFIEVPNPAGNTFVTDHDISTEDTFTASYTGSSVTTVRSTEISADEDTTDATLKEIIHTATERTTVINGITENPIYITGITDDASFTTYFITDTIQSDSLNEKELITETMTTRTKDSTIPSDMKFMTIGIANSAETTTAHDVNEVNNSDNTGETLVTDVSKIDSSEYTWGTTTVAPTHTTKKTDVKNTIDSNNDVTTGINFRNDISTTQEYTLVSIFNNNNNGESTAATATTTSSATTTPLTTNNIVDDTMERELSSFDDITDATTIRTSITDADVTMILRTTDDVGPVFKIEGSSEKNVDIAHDTSISNRYYLNNVINNPSVNNTEYNFETTIRNSKMVEEISTSAATTDKYNVNSELIPGDEVINMKSDWTTRDSTLPETTDSNIVPLNTQADGKTDWSVSNEILNAKVTTSKTVLEAYSSRTQQWVPAVNIALINTADIDYDETTKNIPLPEKKEILISTFVDSNRDAYNNSEGTSDIETSGITADSNSTPNVNNIITTNNVLTTSRSTTVHQKLTNISSSSTITHRTTTNAGSITTPTNPVTISATSVTNPGIFYPTNVPNTTRTPKRADTEVALTTMKSITSTPPVNKNSYANNTAPLDRIPPSNSTANISTSYTSPSSFSASVKTSSPYAFICSAVGKFANPADNSTYYVCSRRYGGGFHIMLFSCPRKTVYFPALAKCASVLWISGTETTTSHGARLVRRSADVIPESSENAERRRSSYVCRTAGKFPDPNECNIYLVCITRTHGVLEPLMFNCLPGSSFDPESELCRRDFPCGIILKLHD